MRRYTARPKRRGVSSYEDTPRPKRRCVSSYEDTPRPKRSVYLEDTPEKMYNVVSLKRIVKCIFGYHSNFGQRNGPKRGACKSLTVRQNIYYTTASTWCLPPLRRSAVVGHLPNPCRPEVHRHAGGNVSHPRRPRVHVDGPRPGRRLGRRKERWPGCSPGERWMRRQWRGIPRGT